MIKAAAAANQPCFVGYVHTETNNVLLGPLDGSTFEDTYPLGIARGNIFNNRSLSLLKKLLYFSLFVIMYVCRATTSSLNSALTSIKVVI